MYFFDTYAIFEIIEDNKGYEKYKSYPLVLSVLNIAEFYGTVLRESGRQKADNLFKEFILEVLEITQI